MKQYHGIITDQLQQGIIEKCDTAISSEEAKIHYLPHRGVMRESVTTKLRIVYDARSRATKYLKSLNDCLFKGPR